MKKKKILLIDDEPDLIAPTKFVLENAGYQVYIAVSAEEGMKKFKEVKPDLILLDIMMPQVDGLEMLYRLRNVYKDTRTVPVIMLTARDDVESTFQAKGFGATEYLVKSASSEALLDKVKKLLSRQK